MVHSGALANPNCISEVMLITYFFVMFVRIAHLFLYYEQVYPAKSGNETWTNYGALLHSSMLTTLAFLITVTDRRLR